MSTTVERGRMGGMWVRGREVLGCCCYCSSSINSTLMGAGLPESCPRFPILSPPPPPDVYPTERQGCACFDKCSPRSRERVMVGRNGVVHSACSICPLPPDTLLGVHRHWLCFLLVGLALPVALLRSTTSPGISVRWSNSTFLCSHVRCFCHLLVPTCKTLVSGQHF